MIAFSETTGVARPSAAIPRFVSVIPRLDPKRRTGGIQGVLRFARKMALTLDAAIESRHDRFFVIPGLDLERRTGGIQGVLRLSCKKMAPTLDAAIESRHDRFFAFPRLDPKRRTGGIQERLAFSRNIVTSLDTGFRRYDRVDS